MTMKISSPGLLGTIDLPLIAMTPITSATTTASAAKVRAPCRGRIVGVTPVYGISAGGTPFTDIDGMVEVGTTDQFTANHALVDSSADQTTEPTLLTTPPAVIAEGTILHLDLVTTGGSTPTAVGYGYIVHFLPE